MSLGNVLEEEGAIGRHRPSDSSPQSEQGDTQPEKTGRESREKAEDGSEEEGEVEGGRATLRVRVCGECLVDRRVTDKQRRTAAPAPSADLCEVSGQPAASKET